MIYVASLGKSFSEAKKKLKDLTHSRSRRDVSDDGQDGVYIAGKLNATIVPTTFEVGRGQIRNGYTNKRLTLGHFYAFSVESCVLDENSVSILTRRDKH